MSAGRWAEERPRQQEHCFTHSPGRHSPRLMSASTLQPGAGSPTSRPSSVGSLHSPTSRPSSAASQRSLASCSRPAASARSGAIPALLVRGGNAQGQLASPDGPNKCHRSVPGLNLATHGSADSYLQAEDGGQLPVGAAPLGLRLGTAIQRLSQHKEARPEFGQDARRAALSPRQHSQQSSPRGFPAQLARTFTCSPAGGQNVRQAFNRVENAEALGVALFAAGSAGQHADQSQQQRQQQHGIRSADAVEHQHEQQHEQQQHGPLNTVAMGDHSTEPFHARGLASRPAYIRSDDGGRVARSQEASNLARVTGSGARSAVVTNPKPAGDVIAAAVLPDTTPCLPAAPGRARFTTLECLEQLPSIPLPPERLSAPRPWSTDGAPAVLLSPRAATPVVLPLDVTYRARAAVLTWPMLAPFVPRMLRRHILRSHPPPGSFLDPAQSSMHCSIGAALEKPPTATIHQLSSAMAPSLDTFQAALLVTDVSGFTALTEALSAQGSAGVELLTKCMNNYFTKVIDLLLLYGGDVEKFAGDCMIVVFVPTQEEAQGADDGGLWAATQRAVTCGHELSVQYGAMRMMLDGEVQPVPVTERVTAGTAVREASAGATVASSTGSSAGALAGSKASAVAGTSLALARSCADTPEGRCRTPQVAVTAEARQVVGEVAALSAAGAAAGSGPCGLSNMGTSLQGNGPTPLPSLLACQGSGLASLASAATRDKCSGHDRSVASQPGTAKEQRLARQRRLHEQALAELAVLAQPTSAQRPPELPSPSNNASEAARLAAQQRQQRRTTLPQVRPARLLQAAHGIGDASSGTSDRPAGGRMLRTTTAPAVVAGMLGGYAAQHRAGQSGAAALGLAQGGLPSLPSLGSPGTTSEEDIGSYSQHGNARVGQEKPQTLDLPRQQQLELTDPKESLAPPSATPPASAQPSWPAPAGWASGSYTGLNRWVSLAENLAPAPTAEVAAHTEQQTATASQAKAERLSSMLGGWLRAASTRWLGPGGSSLAGRRAPQPLRRSKASAQADSGNTLNSLSMLSPSPSLAEISSGLSLSAAGSRCCSCSLARRGLEDPERNCGTLLAAAGLQGHRASQHQLESGVPGGELHGRGADAARPTRAACALLDRDSNRPALLGAASHSQLHLQHSHIGSVERTVLLALADDASGAARGSLQRQQQQERWRQQHVQAVVQSALLSLKVVVAAGAVCSYHVGGGREAAWGDDGTIPRWEFFLGDPPCPAEPIGGDQGAPRLAISQLRAAEPSAMAGEVVLSREVVQLLGGACSVEWLQAGSARLVHLQHPHALSPEGGSDAEHLAPLQRAQRQIAQERAALGALPEVAQGHALQLLRMHILESMRVRVEAGHITTSTS